MRREAIAGLGCRKVDSRFWAIRSRSCSVERRCHGPDGKLADACYDRPVLNLARSAVALSVGCRTTCLAGTASKPGSRMAYDVRTGHPLGAGGAPCEPCLAGLLG